MWHLLKTRCRRWELGRAFSIRPVDIPWPHSLGFIGAVGVAAALELIPIPTAIFVFGVPFVKQLNRSNTPNGRTPYRRAQARSADRA